MRSLSHRGGTLPLGGRPLLMGILNVTPDSFSDGGLHAAPTAALAGARRLAAEGADILDIGAESTRPGYAPVPAEAEWARLAPVLEGLGAIEVELPPISVDTAKAEVARRALAAGAVIVNDVFGLRRDPAMAEVIAEAGAGAVLMHNRNTIDPGIDILGDILRAFEESLRRAAAAGIRDHAIVLDPGIGFGKTLAQNLAAIAGLPRLAELGFPILLGTSRKSFIARLCAAEPPAGDRLPGTIAANLLGALGGAAILRVHDVAAHAQALAVMTAIRKAV